MIEPAYRYRVAVVRVIDGDTYVVNVDLGFRTHVELEVRLHGWSCAELPTTEGRRARDRVTQLVSGHAVVVETYRDQRSFSRWVADVYVDGNSLGELLAAEGLARHI